MGDDYCLQYNEGICECVPYAHICCSVCVVRFMRLVEVSGDDLGTESYWKIYILYRIILRKPLILVVSIRLLTAENHGLSSAVYGRESLDGSLVSTD